MRSAWVRIAVLGSGLLAVSGCTSPSPEPLEVTGVVYYAGAAPTESGGNSNTATELVGKPIVGAKVTFHNHELPIGYGITDTLGRFRIRAYPVKADPIDGLPVGLYAVTITKLSLVEKPSPMDTGEDTRESSDRPLPARYAHPHTTEWQAIEVKLESSANHFRLAVSE